MSNISENLLYEIRKITYYLYRTNEITNKLYNNKMNSINIMDTIYMNSRNNKTSDTHRSLLNLSDKIDLKKNDKYVVSWNLTIYYAWKNTIQKSYKNNKVKISSPASNKYFEFFDGSYSVSDIQD